MQKLSRITMDPQVMGGKPCIRSMRVTVGTLVGLMASGKIKQHRNVSIPSPKSETSRSPPHRTPKLISGSHK